MQIPADEWRSLSHRQRRVLVNKERRRIKRKAAALKREEEQVTLESQPGYLERIAAEEKMAEEIRHKDTARQDLEHEAWLERERVAQEEFRVRREREEKELREKEDRERLIREEWELLQQREKEAGERKETLRKQKEERLQEALATEHRPAVEKPTHNPLAPEGYAEPNPKNYGTEKDARNCPFFLKTGACRFGDTCSRIHPYPQSSTTLLIPAMYASLGLSEWKMDDRDDSILEYEEGDMYEQFRSFYDDVFPEFAEAGEILQFKVSCNYEPHLRGNVYVQYKSEEQCAAAFQKFNGRWYAQRQLSCQFCPVQRWRNAICGLYNQKRCPKGKHCNFLHVFRNPGGAFARADRDLPTFSPPSRRERRERSRSRSRSRERRRSRRDSREDSRDRRRRWRSRSRERRRSRSRRRSSHTRHRSHSSDRRGRERRRQSSERESEDRKSSATDINGLNSETVSSGEQKEDREGGKGHKKKKKKRKRSDNSKSPSKRHHKHKKHKKKRERSGSRETEVKMDNSEKCDNNASLGSLSREIACVGQGSVETGPPDPNPAE